MARSQKDPLRPLTTEERTVLTETARSRSEQVSRVARARILLALAEGASFTQAAAVGGFRSGYGVAQLVRRFNRDGLLAVAGRHGGGPALAYGPTAQERILREFRRPPDRERDGTATWSLSTLQRALRTAPDGLPAVSTFTILVTLHQAGYSWQENRTWCHTGTAFRKRKRPDGTSEVVQVTDPQASEKRGTSSEPIP
jgi:transposase